MSISRDPVVRTADCLDAWPHLRIFRPHAAAQWRSATIAVQFGTASCPLSPQAAEPDDVRTCAVGTQPYDDDFPAVQIGTDG